MALKHSNDFNGTAKKILDKIEHLRRTTGLNGDYFIPLLAGELHNVWLDAYNGSVLDHTPKTNKKKGNE